MLQCSFNIARPVVLGLILLTLLLNGTLLNVMHNKSVINTCMRACMLTLTVAIRVKFNYQYIKKCDP